MKNLHILSFLVVIIMNMVQAETGNLVLRINDNFTIEASAASDGNDQNFIRQFARSCGDENFEMMVQLRIKPFAVDKDTVVAEAEEAYHKDLRDLLFSKDENGQTALDIARERETATKCQDCTLIKEGIQFLMHEILKAEYEKKLKEVEIQ